jgi:hypothetical protein
LFEGNTGQNIVIDDSHGTNGPYNTFFRNRADLYGIYMNSNPPSNNQNLVGNEVTSNASFQGLYTLAGTGHFAYGNNIRGTIMPAGTAVLTDTSYYRETKPSYFSSGATWPSIGPPNTIGSGTIPAQQRQSLGINLTDCQTNYPFIQYTSISDTFCSGSTYNFNGNILSMEGIYEDTILTLGGYDSIITLQLLAREIDTAVTINGLILSSDETNGNYQWIDCANNSPIANETGQIFTPSQSGLYKVQVSKDNCVAESACVSVTISDIRKEEQLSFCIYPNPVKDFCTLNLFSNSKISGAVYNVLGENVLQLFSNESIRQYRFDTRSLSGGCYFIKITDQKNRTAIQRIVVAQ